MKKIQLGEKFSHLTVSEWVQGDPIDIEKLIGQVVLIEVFQINCPGCFLYGLPQAIEMHEKYRDQGLTVFGIATAFEDFDKNTLANLKRLVDTGEVIGETLRVLGHQDLLNDGKLHYRIPFPLAMDRLIERQTGNGSDEVDEFIKTRIPDFARQPIRYQEEIRRNVEHYLANLKYRAETFEAFDLKGTPSAILIDKQGRYRDSLFGHDPELEYRIHALLDSSAC
ncbi:MAG: hypothetical protein Kow0065_21240 [Methylomicrobium sp.]